MEKECYMRHMGGMVNTSPFPRLGGGEKTHDGSLPSFREARACLGLAALHGPVILATGRAWPALGPRRTLYTLYTVDNWRS